MKYQNGRSRVNNWEINYRIKSKLMIGKNAQDAEGSLTKKLQPNTSLNACKGQLQLTGESDHSYSYCFNAQYYWDYPITLFCSSPLFPPSLLTWSFSVLALFSWAPRLTIQVNQSVALPVFEHNAINDWLVQVYPWSHLFGSTCKQTYWLWFLYTRPSLNSFPLWTSPW